MIRFDIVTVFPDVIENYCNASIIGRARKQKLVTIQVHNLRDWTTDKHHTVDDRVFGGGPGMLMKPEPLYKAIRDLKKRAIEDGFTPKVIATAASGNLLTQQKAKKMAISAENMSYIILCGHYEGFDARIDEWIDEKVAIGPYVLTGGELPALIMVDSISRLIPGVLGNNFSAEDETTFTLLNDQLEVTGEHPQYTTPSSFVFEDEHGQKQVREVPAILRSGNHKKILEENLSRRVKKTLLESK